MVRHAGRHARWIGPLVLALAVLTGTAAPAKAQFLGYGMGMGGYGMGMGLGGYGMGMGGYGMGYGGLGYGGLGYGGLGWGGYGGLGWGGYGYPFLGYGWGYGFPWYNSGFFSPFGYGLNAGFPYYYGGFPLAYGLGYANPMFGMGLSPLGVYSSLGEHYLFGSPSHYAQARLTRMGVLGAPASRSYAITVVPTR